MTIRSSFSTPVRHSTATHPTGTRPAAPHSQGARAAGNRSTGTRSTSTRSTSTRQPVPAPTRQPDPQPRRRPTTAEKLADFTRMRDEALGAEQQEARAGHASRGSAPAKGENSSDKQRLSARERLDVLLDKGSFVETDQLARHRTQAFGMSKKRPYTDGIVTGWGTIEGREVCVFSQDRTIFGGALGEAYGEKMIKIMELAAATGRPLIGLYDGAGARIQDGAISLDLIAQTFYHNVQASGVVPQISVIMGPCAGGNAYSPALTDFVVMVDESSTMFVTGPDVITTVTGERMTKEELGGASTHMHSAGTSHYTATSEEDAFDWVRDVLRFLPNNNRDQPPLEEPVDLSELPSVDELALDSIIPDSPSVPYDVRTVITALSDDADFLEIQQDRAPNVVTAFGLVDGHPVGFVANQPTHFAGCLDIDASEKAARFVRTCDAFNIPIVMLVDVPGFLPGINQEHDGILRRGAKLLYAYAEATVPKVTVVMRKAYGGAYCVMGSKGLGADVNLAWPTAEIAVMGAAGAIGFLHRKELQAAAAAGDDLTALIEEYEHRYNDHFLNPYRAAERGLIDAVLLPSETRIAIIRNLRLLRSKVEHRHARKHGNIPL